MGAPTAFESVLGAVWRDRIVAVLGILTCEVLELEFGHLLATDGEIGRITVLEDERSSRLLSALERHANRDVRCISTLDEFRPDGECELEVLIRVLELGLHIWPKKLREALVEAAHEMSRYSDAILLGYGLCGNALEAPRELLADIGVPVFIPMDEDHPVDDCVGLLIGGRERYYAQQRKVAGTFFITPGWSSHWQRLFDLQTGGVNLEMARRMFEHYERTLVISSPVMSEEEMRRSIGEFVELFNFRVETCEGTLSILTRAWEEAKGCLRARAR
jgi:hypothetical protein